MLGKLIEKKRWLGAAALVAGMFASGATLATHVEPTLVAGNPSCTDLGYDFGYKPQPEPPPSETYTFPDTTSTVTINSDGTFFNWTSTLGIDAVIVKGGSNANVYAYDPPEEEFQDTGLHSPVNSSGSPAAISHIEFCYDFEVTVSKTAKTTFSRTYSWTLDKDGPDGPLNLAAGQTYLASYSVTLGTAYVDSNWAVSGEITIANDTPFNATITGVSDSITGVGAVTVNCPVTFDYVLVAGGTLTCTYSTSLPDGTSRTNTATVTTSASSIVGGGTAQAAIAFTNPTTEVDACVSLHDDQYAAQNGGALLDAEVCVDELPYVKEYTLAINQTNACTTSEFVNTADAKIGDTVVATDTYTVEVDEGVCIPTGPGCTLTQGYWKTHSGEGPAPYDDNWANLGPLQEDTVFFLSSKTYYQVLWTAPAGNVYYVLAQQYIAAQLNQLNGASLTGDALAAFNQATTFFNTYTPTTAAALRGTAKATYTSLAATLDQYNNGLIGPGHCSE
jgi:hypothetical protein